MKYTIEGYSQERLISLGLDNTDALILRYFSDFYLTGGMSSAIGPNGKEFVWMNYKSVLQDLPCLGLTTPDSVARRFKKMVDCGVLEHHHRKVGGSFSMYRMGAEYGSLVNGPPTDEKSEGSGLKVGPPTDEKSEQKTLLLENSSTKRKEERHKHGEYNHVLLTTSELDNLKRDFPLDWQDRITRLDEYIEMKGTKYANHNLTIRNWARRDQAAEPKVLTDAERLAIIEANRRKFEAEKKTQPEMRFSGGGY